jgi:hypothetical protein
MLAHIEKENFSHEGHEDTQRKTLKKFSVSSCSFVVYLTLFASGLPEVGIPAFKMKIGTTGRSPLQRGWG